MVYDLCGRIVKRVGNCDVLYTLNGSRIFVRQEAPGESALPRRNKPMLHLRRSSAKGENAWGTVSRRIWVAVRGLNLPFCVPW